MAEDVTEKPSKMLLKWPILSTFVECLKGMSLSFHLRPICERLLEGVKWKEWLKGANKPEQEILKKGQIDQKSTILSLKLLT